MVAGAGALTIVGDSSSLIFFAEEMLIVV